MSEGSQLDSSRWTQMFDWAYVGVDHSLPGNGGQDCVDFIPLWQRVLESGLACVFAAFTITYAYKRVRLPVKIPPIERSDRCGKRVLLVVMCLTFGIELGFKFATRQFIWICNPCHITSMIQVRDKNIFLTHLSSDWIMFLSFWTDRSGQTVQIQISVLLVWSGSTLFAIPSASFGCITLRKHHIQLLGWLQQTFGCPKF